MEKKILSKKQEELVERAGVLFEQDGFSPAASRIRSLLIVADEPELTFEEIYTTLNLSKSAASNAINLLISMQKIEYITRPGERKRYFRTRIMQLDNHFKELFKGMDEMLVIFKEVYDQKPKGHKDFNTVYLKELIVFMELIKKELPIIFRNWKEKRI